LTQLVRALSTQEATATPSPPAVAFERAVADKAPASPAQHPVTSTQIPAPAPTPDITEEVMKAVAHQIESYLKANGRDLQFSIDQESGRTVVTVRNSSTGEVIRQIPDVEALRIAQSLGGHPGTLLDVTI
jgi:flagellar protein FlaG